MKVTEVPQIKIPEDKKDLVIMVAAFGWLQDLSEEGYVTKRKLEDRNSCCGIGEEIL